MEDFIQLKKSSILRFGLKDEEGNPTGNYLEFDLEDIELPLKLNKMEYELKKNKENLKLRFVVIDKQQDKKGKFLLSYNEEEKIKAIKEFCDRTMATYDLFLGEDGCKKILNGRKPYYSMFDDIDEMIKPILPKLKTNADGIINKIKSKYSDEEKDVLE